MEQKQTENKSKNSHSKKYERRECVENHFYAYEIIKKLLKPETCNYTVAPVCALLYFAVNSFSHNILNVFCLCAT